MPLFFHAQDNAYAQEVQRALGVSVMAPLGGVPRREVACTKEPGSVLRSEEGVSLTLTKHQLGAGAFGAVVSGFLKTPALPVPMLVAVKKIRLKARRELARKPEEMTARGHREMRLEFEIARECDAPLGAPLLLTTRKKSYLVLPHVEGTFVELTRTLGHTGLAEAQAMHAAPVLFSELAQMHERGYSHLDIKGHNLLFSGTDVHLGDFGYSLRSIVGKVGSKWYGTHWCSAPETLDPRGQEVDLQKSDVFALSMTLLIGSTGEAGERLYHRLVDITAGVNWRAYYREVHELWSRNVDVHTGFVDFLSLPGMGPTGTQVLEEFEDCALTVKNGRFRALLLSALGADPERRPSAAQAARSVPFTCPQVLTLANHALALRARERAQEHATALRATAARMLAPDDDKATGRLLTV